MARPGWPERNRGVRSFRQLRRFHRVINSDKVFGTHRGDDDYWVTWAELERCVRTGRTASEHLFGAKDAFQRYAANPRFAPIFNAGMTASSATTAAAVLANYDFSTVKSVTDVGGGQGHLIAAILKA